MKITVCLFFTGVSLGMIDNQQHLSLDWEIARQEWVDPPVSAGALKRARVDDSK